TEWSGHHPIEFAPPAECHGTLRRSEIGHDADQHLIALLPIAARHVEWKAGSLAPGGRTLKNDVRALRYEPTRFDVNLLGIKSERQLARNREVPGKRRRRERAPLVIAANAVGRQGGRHRLNAFRRGHRQGPATRPFRKSSERPLQDDLFASGSPCESKPGKLLELRQNGKVDSVEARREPCGRPLGGAERLN